MAKNDEGFLDFGMGVNDDDVGKKVKNFKMKDGTAVRVSFGWFSTYDAATKTWNDEAAWDDKGGLKPEAVIRFAGCPRIYIKGVGNVLVPPSKTAAYAQWGKPKDAYGTIVVVWPCNDEGELDAEKFKAGKGWQVQPWVHQDGEKYLNLKKIDKRNPFMKHDVLFSCPENGGEFQKITFVAEDSNLLLRLLGSDKPEARAMGEKIAAACRTLAKGMKDEMARSMTPEEIKEKLSGGGGKDGEGGGGGSGGGRADKDVEGLLDGMV